MDSGPTRNKQYLNVRMAATLAYIGLVGHPPEIDDSVVMFRTLNDVAHALAVLAPLYMYEDGELKPLDAALLIGGRFARGGAVLIGPDGKEHSQLVIQRGELEFAISVLSKTVLAKSLKALHA